MCLCFFSAVESSQTADYAETWTQDIVFKEKGSLYATAPRSKVSISKGTQKLRFVVNLRNAEDVQKHVRGSFSLINISPHIADGCKDPFPFQICNKDKTQIYQ